MNVTRRRDTTPPDYLFLISISKKWAGTHDIDLIIEPDGRLTLERLDSTYGLLTDTLDIQQTVALSYVISRGLATVIPLPGTPD